MKDNLDTLSKLREQHLFIEYTSYSYSCDDLLGKFFVQYEFVLSPDIYFRPTIEISGLGRFENTPVVERLVFLLGMVELISYWKLACPENILVTCGSLSHDECLWWESLFRNGLGEFFFVNGISPALSFKIQATHETFLQIDQIPKSEYGDKTALVMIGGGKDSCVGLEIIKSVFGAGNLRPFCINPIPASLSVIEVAQVGMPVTINRKISQELIRLNREGSYLNGHTPFSALLSFAGVLAAVLVGADCVVASNEASASEGNITYQGFEVNHQYSKSLDYEKRFRAYMEQLNVPVSYYSVLRPLNEIQIAGLFSEESRYFAAFQSCNRMQTMEERKTLSKSQWCGRCSKCVFTYIVLACFLDDKDLRLIFGDRILECPENLEFIQELLGEDGRHKPLECVGTSHEVLIGLCSYIRHMQEKNISISENMTKMVETRLSDFNRERRVAIDFWNNEHFLPEDVANQLRQNLSKLT